MTHADAIPLIEQWTDALHQQRSDDVRLARLAYGLSQDAALTYQALKEAVPEIPSRATVSRHGTCYGYWVASKLCGEADLAEVGLTKAYIVYAFCSQTGADPLEWLAIARDLTVGELKKDMDAFRPAGEPRKHLILPESVYLQLQTAIERMYDVNGYAHMTNPLPFCEVVADFLTSPNVGDNFLRLMWDNAHGTLDKTAPEPEEDDGD